MNYRSRPPGAEKKQCKHQKLLNCFFEIFLRKFKKPDVTTVFTCTYRSPLHAITGLNSVTITVGLYPLYICLQ